MRDVSNSEREGELERESAYSQMCIAYGDTYFVEIHDACVYIGWIDE
jgi:hypothetical protein